MRAGVVTERGRVSRAATLFRGELKRSFIEVTRYPVDLVSGIVVLYVFFLLIFLGARALISGPTGGETVSGIVVGYMVWVISIFSYSSTTSTLTLESTAGTLEQMSMSPFGLPRVLATKFVAGLGIQLVTMGAILVLMMATTGRWLHIDVLSLFPLLVLTVAGVFGVGLAIGGLAVVFKRIQQLLQVVQFLFVGLIAAPLDRVPFVKYLPLKWGTELVSRVMIDGVPITRMPLGDLVFLVVHAAAWVAFGLLVFRRLERVARDRALLSQY